MVEGGLKYMVEKKEKQSNYELMRLISMFMIVLWHVIGNNVPIDKLDSALSFVINLILFCLVVHVNSFVLLTGYFSTEKKTTWKKAVSLLATSWMYRIAFACIIFFTALVPMSKIQFFQEMMPFDVTDYWFINCYLLLLLLVPFLNIFVDQIDNWAVCDLVVGSLKVFKNHKEEGYEIITEEGKIKAEKVVIASHYPIVNAPGFYFMKMYQVTSYLIAVETKEPLFKGMYINSEDPTISLRTAKQGEKRLLLIGRNGPQNRC